jgi:DNA replication and repair protein RecF
MFAEIYLKNISLTNFKSYNNAYFDFSAGLNFITGNNGLGKTNLLDAIYVSAMTKSAFVPDARLIRFEEDFFSIKAMYALDFKENVCLTACKKNKPKIVRWNDCEYESMSEHIGKIPLILIKPDDSEIINGGSEERRKFFDNLISQADSAYLKNLLRCNFLLKERNALLKNAAENKKMPDFDLVKTYDAQILPLFEKIYAARKKVSEQFLPVFIQIYAHIGKSREIPEIFYQSPLSSEDFIFQYEKNFSRDMLLERTELGTHKDDFIFNINEFLLKKTGSQGQIKTFLLSLKLAAYLFLRNHLRKSPLLLLDDIADKLDNDRLTALSELISGEDFGQIFITDAHQSRMYAYFPDIEARKIVLY